MLFLRWFLIFSVVEVRASFVDFFYRNPNCLRVICFVVSRKFSSLVYFIVSTFSLSDGRTEIGQYLQGSCLSPDLKRSNTLPRFDILGNNPFSIHLFIRTTKLSEKFGLKNLTNWFGIPYFPSEFEFLRFEHMLKISAVVLGNRNIGFSRILETTSSLLCLIFASILLPKDVNNSIASEGLVSTWVWRHRGFPFF